PRRWCPAGGRRAARPRPGGDACRTLFRTLGRDLDAPRERSPRGLLPRFAAAHRTARQLRMQGDAVAAGGTAVLARRPRPRCEQRNEIVHRRVLLPRFHRPLLPVGGTVDWFNPHT